MGFHTILVRKRYWSEESTWGLPSMNVIINIKPYTTWNLLDYIIVQLGKEGNKICVNRISDDPFYNAVVDLICKKNIRELPRQIIIVKPFYPYILLTYYVLFNKGDLDLAKVIYKRLSEVYVDNSNLFDRNEEISLKIIGEVVEFFDTLRELDKNIHMNILEYHLEVLVGKLNKVECIENNEWSCLFKNLIISDLEPNLERRYRRLRSVKEVYKVESIPIDEELIEGYNLFMTEEFSPIYTFLSNIAERKIEDLEQLYEKVHKLEMEKNDIKEKLDKIIHIQRMLRIYTEEAKSIFEKASTYWPIIGGLALGIITISYISYIGLSGLIFTAMFLSIYLLKLIEVLIKRKLKTVEERINYLKSSKVEKLAEIIWPL